MRQGHNANRKRKQYKVFAEARAAAEKDGHELVSEWLMRELASEPSESADIREEYEMLCNGDRSCDMNETHEFAMCNQFVPGMTEDDWLKVIHRSANA